MKKGRLLKLAALLDTVPRRRFDMGTWGVASKVIKDKPVCATRACALGWATAIPEFKRAGLQLVQDYEGSTGADVYFKDRIGSDAGRVFFGLTDEQADWLFHDGAEDPKGKAAEIREMVKAGASFDPPNVW